MTNISKGIYIASKVKHAERWKAMRAKGTPIISTWIDEAGPGDTLDWEDLWHRCIYEASNAVALIVYHEEGEDLKGALAEVGAALANNKPVYIIGPFPYSIAGHKLAKRVTSFPDAFVEIFSKETFKSGEIAKLFLEYVMNSEEEFSNLIDNTDYCIRLLTEQQAVFEMNRYAEYNIGTKSQLGIIKYTVTVQGKFISKEDE